MRQVSWLSGLCRPSRLPRLLNEWRANPRSYGAGFWSPALRLQWRDRVGFSPTSLLPSAIEAPSSRALKGAAWHDHHYHPDSALSNRTRAGRRFLVTRGPHRPKSHLSFLIFDRSPFVFVQSERWRTQSRRRRGTAARNDKGQMTDDQWQMKKERRMPMLAPPRITEALQVWSSAFRLRWFSTG